MRKLVAKLFSFPWHPWVLGIYPVMSLYAQNIEQAEPAAIVRSLAVSFVLSCVLVALLRMLFSDWHRAGSYTAVLLLLFFSYGHVYNYVEDVKLFGILLGRHRFLLIIWLGLAILALIATLRWNAANHTVSLNAIAIVLLLFPAVTITAHEFSARTLSASDAESASSLSVGNSQSLPDVYYIILDSYTRSDVLKKEYGYDNSPFLDDLRGMGFYVAECSTSNYMWTRLSMSSALNMEYLQDHPSYIAAADKDAVTRDFIQHSLVRKTFESIGYKTVAFATGFPSLELRDADLYLEPPSSMRDIREFEALLSQTTLLRVFQDLGYIRINQTATANFRDRTLFALSEFDDLPRLGGPKFVYIHIITPHPPFVFGPNGENVDPKEFKSTEAQYSDEIYSKGYVNQVKFISDQIAGSVQKLLDESPVPPIILIQGDHGPWKQQGENRVSILNAYYLPGHPDAVYPAISPVNSFRVIFNEYFNAAYPLLEDVSYRSPYATPYDFRLQPTSCASSK